MADTKLKNYRSEILFDSFLIYNHSKLAAIVRQMDASELTAKQALNITGKNAINNVQGMNKLFKAAFDPKWGNADGVEELYQLLGTDVARTIDPNVWVKNAEMFYKNAIGFSVVITDVRFANEAKWIRDKGGIVVYINRQQKEIQANTHSSENGLSGKDVDVYIENDGTINDLYEQVENIQYAEYKY